MPSSENAVLEWEICVVDSNYEICKTYPFQIRKINNHRIIKETLRPDGYIQVRLNKKLYLKHQIIAKQFIPNSENYKCIDHINHIRTDNRIENLRWCSYRQNNNQKSDQKFVDDIPEDAIKVESYNGWQFEELFFHEDIFYVFNGINYNVKPKYQNKFGYYAVYLRDISGKFRAISYIKFKREYGLI